MGVIAEGVEFDTIAREWRCKWSKDADSASLVAAQKLLKATEPELKKIDGLKSVQRVVCGGCQDFKVIIALDAEKYGAWDGAAHAPEANFLEALKKIDGISSVETQTYTLMPVL